MALTTDFDIYPRWGVKRTTSPYGMWVKCYDKTYKATAADAEPTSWLWVVGSWRYVAPDATSNRFYLTNADYIFPTGTQVVFYAYVTYPTGISTGIAYWVVESKATYFEVSTAKGGTPVDFTTNGSSVGAYAASNLQHPVVYLGDITAPTNFDVGLNVNAGGETLKTALGHLWTSESAKPTDAGNFMRFSILVYDSPKTASPTAKLINLNKTGASTLRYSDLVFTDSMNKAGKATFTVLADSTSTAAEIALMDTDKCVAIIGGRSVVWSGKIIRAIQSKMSLYATTSPIKLWEVECESDISKMKLQGVKAANQIAVTGTIGYIMNKLLETDGVTGSIDWRQGSVGFDFDKSLIATDGPKISYTITNEDMYTQFMKLASLVDFDWRTRCNYLRYYYSSFVNATGVITTAYGTGFSGNELVGDWVVFVNVNNASAVRNQGGAQAFGKITANTASTITCTVINGANPPAVNDYIIVVRRPVVDVAYDLTHYGTDTAPIAPSRVGKFTFNAPRQASLRNGYELDDKTDYKALSTKVICSGKAFNPLSAQQTSVTTAVSVTARDEWDNAYGFFENESYITYRMDGYVYAFTAGNAYIDIIGQNLAYQNADKFYVYSNTAGVWSILGAFTVSGATALRTEIDGTLTTRITATGLISLGAIYKWSLLIGEKLYVKDKTWVSEDGLYTTLTIGNEIRQYTNASSGTDATYGDYLKITSSGGIGYGSTVITPHYAGVIVQNSTRASIPDANSPVGLYGVKEGTFIVDNSITKSDLEVYSSARLIMGSRLWKKASFWCFGYDWYKTSYRNSYQAPFAINDAADYIRVGDQIEVSTVVGDPVSNPLQKFQVVQVSFKLNEMKFSIDLGDHDKNVFTQMIESTSAINRTIT